MASSAKVADINRSCRCLPEASADEDVNRLRVREEAGVCLVVVGGILSVEGGCLSSTLRALVALLNFLRSIRNLDLSIVHS